MAPQVVIRRIATGVLLFAVFIARPVAAQQDPDARLRTALELRDQNQLRESIGILEELRRSNPSSVEIARLEAETRAWAGQLCRARSLYADLAGRGDVASELGLAQTDAWQGNLPAAARRYEMLTGVPEARARALLGLARVRTWQRRTSDATRLLVEAQALGPTGPEGTRIHAEIQGERVARGLALGSFQSDSDGNQWFLAGGGWSWMLGGGDLRAEVVFRAGSVEDDDGEFALRGTEAAVEGAIGGVWSAGLRAGIESRDPDPGAATQRFPGSAYIRADGGLWRLNVGAAEEPLSETPDLVRSDIRLTSGRLEAAWSPRTWVGVEAGTSFGRFSDHNERTSVRTALRLRLPEVRLRPSIGWIHRSFWMKEGDVGRAYFSPDHYRSDEAELRFDDALFGRKLRWSLAGTLGAQRIADGSLDTVRSLSLDVDFRPSPSVAVSLGAGRSDVAADSPSGYRLSRVTLRTGVAF